MLILERQLIALPSPYVFQSFIIPIYFLGVAHRDLKPENILCRYEDRVCMLFLAYLEDIIQNPVVMD